MLSAPGRRYVLGVCLILASCGRLGVHVIPEESEPDAEPPPNQDGTAAEPDAGEELKLADDADTNPYPRDDGAVPVDSGTALDTGGLLDAGPELDVGTPFDAGAAYMAIQDAGDAAAPTDAGPDAAPPACGGAIALNLCWYLSIRGESCEQTCSARGGHDARATAIVGTTGQGGSLSNCVQVLAALGHTGLVGAGARNDGLGLGCHTWDADGWWLQTMPSFDPKASYPPVRIACGCVR